MSSDRELRDSIAAAGCINPILIWLGLVIDGRRRHRICEELGVVPPMHVLVSLQAACSALFAHHPERAVVLAQEHLGGHAGLAPTIRELAEVCGTSVSVIALVLKPATKPEARGPRRSRSDRTELVRVWVEPQWLHYVRLVGAAQGMSLSATVRKACWEFVQRNAPRAPTEGTDRSPSVEAVRPKIERRRLPPKR